MFTGTYFLIPCEKRGPNERLLRYVANINNHPHSCQHQKTDAMQSGAVSLILVHFPEVWKHTMTFIIVLFNLCQNV